MVTFSTQLVLKKTMPFISVPSQLLAFSVSSTLFSNVKPTYRMQLSAMRNLALFNGRGMGPLLVLVSPCFREKCMLSRAKLGLLCVVHIVYFRKT